MTKLPMSKTNPIHLKPPEIDRANFIFGRIQTQEKEEQFCEVMTGHLGLEKTIVHSIPFEQGMIFVSQYGKHEVIEVIETRKSKYRDKRFRHWSKINTKFVV